MLRVPKLVAPKLADAKACGCQVQYARAYMFGTPTPSNVEKSKHWIIYLSLNSLIIELLNYLLVRLFSYLNQGQVAITGIMAIMVIAI